MREPAIIAIGPAVGTECKAADDNLFETLAPGLHNRQGDSDRGLFRGSHTHRC